MITAKDRELRGVSNRSDAMGVLAGWSVRDRDLVPHLTEQIEEPKNRAGSGPRLGHWRPPPGPVLPRLQQE